MDWDGEWMRSGGEVGEVVVCECLYGGVWSVIEVGEVCVSV